MSTQSHDDGPIVDHRCFVVNFTSDAGSCGGLSVKTSFAHGCSHVTSPIGVVLSEVLTLRVSWSVITNALVRRPSASSFSSRATRTR